MPNILVRDLSPDTVERLKRRAKMNRRSVQAEAATLIERGVARDSNPYADFLAWSIEFVKKTANTPQTDSAELIREDRDSDHGRA